jgi:PKD repeat protein
MKIFFNQLLLRIKVNHILTKLIALFVIFYAGVTSPVFGQIPVADFSANKTSGCAPLTVNFTDQSSGNPTSWNWDLGNGQLTTVKNPIVTYSQPGIYTVKLVVRNANGIDQKEKIDYITVFSSPSASFSANLTTACKPANIQFTDQSTAPGGATITQWQWNFGDGGTSNLQNPTHIYNANGFYTVSLTITSST